MTRALGDEFYQINGKDIVPAEPDITVHKIDQDLDHFLLVVSDGMLENVSPQSLVDYVRIRQQDPQIDLSGLMQEMCEEVIDYSSDNLTSVFVCLKKD